MQNTVCSHKATFYVKGRVNWHKCIIQSTESPHSAEQQEIYSPQMNNWHAVKYYVVPSLLFFKRTKTKTMMYDLEVWLVQALISITRSR
jgi:hypothetical protein